MIVMISIIILTICVFGVSLIKLNPLKAFLIAGTFSVLSSLAYAYTGHQLLEGADKVEALTEVGLAQVDEQGNYVIYDSAKGVYYYKEREGQLLKEVRKENATVEEAKRGETKNTVVRKRVAISNEFLYFIYKGSNYESKVIVEFKIEDGGLTIQQ